MPHINTVICVGKMLSIFFAQIRRLRHMSPGLKLILHKYLADILDRNSKWLSRRGTFPGSCLSHHLRGINRAGKIVQSPFSVCFSRSAYFILAEILRDKGWRQPHGVAEACCRTGPACGICVRYSHSVKESLCERGGVERMCFQLRP